MTLNMQRKKVNGIRAYPCLSGGRLVFVKKNVFVVMESFDVFDFFFFVIAQRRMFQEMGTNRPPMRSLSLAKRLRHS